MLFSSVISTMPHHSSTEENGASVFQWISALFIIFAPLFLARCLLTLLRRLVLFIRSLYSLYSFLLFPGR